MKFRKFWIAVFMVVLVSAIICVINFFHQTSFRSPELIAIPHIEQLSHGRKVVHRVKEELREEHKKQLLLKQKYSEEWKIAREYSGENIVKTYSNGYSVSFKKNSYHIGTVRSNRRNPDAMHVAKFHKLMGWEKHNNVFLDIGSSVGFYTYEALHLNPILRTISVEAHPSNRLHLRRSLLINGWSNRTFVSTAGVSDRPGKSKINTNCNGCTNHYVSRTEDTPARFSELSPKEKTTTSTFEIDLLPLTDILQNAIGIGFFKDYKQIKYTKIDIEGFEGFCIDGGMDFFKTARPVVQMECNYLFLKINNESCFTLMERFLEKIGNYEAWTGGPVVLRVEQLKEYVGTELLMIPIEMGVEMVVNNMNKAGARYTKVDLSGYHPGKK